jgi:dUTP pyrophosphatase
MRIKRLQPDVRLPERAHPTDAGMDLFTPVDISIAAGGVVRIGLRIAIETPIGYVGLLKCKSSLAVMGLDVLGGVIDADYRGEIQVVLANMGGDVIEIEAGRAVCQLLVLPVWLGRVIDTDMLSDTSRGEGGFGSTGL